MTDHVRPGPSSGAARRPAWPPTSSAAGAPAAGGRPAGGAPLGGPSIGGPSVGGNSGSGPSAGGQGVSGRPHYSPPPPRNRTRQADPGRDPAPERRPADAARPGTATRPTRSAGHERGLLGWQALALLLVLAGIGGLFDLLLGTHVRGGFNYGIIVASLVAILAVRRSSMFPIVVAPPIVYFVASAVLLLVRSRGLSDRGAAIDIAINWLVYGFPAIAAATAIVLIVAGVRLIANR